ncbi:LAFE_0F17238g1_1 [Lachancea fermentati]|uniref:Dolichyl-diphosphooligosaccharide-protein glycosyltransferase subunit OST5 n=1 Tax=Lachancea fermentati TaxID=4955 RepID=A0A1G4MG85_LACFM|nr:LAFE_0F17238g1_1 [Lachancea fermentati]
MLYEELFKLYRSSPEFEGWIPLDSQKQYAVVTLIGAIVCIAIALNSISKSRKASIPDYFKFFIMSIIGSLFLGTATVFLTDSFGVYV